MLYKNNNRKEEVKDNQQLVDQINGLTYSV